MKQKIVIGALALVLILIGFGIVAKGTRGGAEVEYRYSTIEKGELVRSTSATGSLVPLTTVDVKSKAGGKVVKLAVEEGSVVKKGDLIALIDPSDTEAIYQQADADVRSAQAKVAQAKTNASMQVTVSKSSLHDAQVQVQLAQIRLDKAREDMRTQPRLTEADIATAQAGLRAQEQTLAKLKQVDFPQRRRDAQSAVRRTKVELSTARAEYERQQKLLAKGYAPRSAVEQAQNSFENAQSAYETAQQRMETFEQELNTDLRAQEARVAQAKASLAQAEANRSKLVTTKKSLEEAERTLAQSKIALQRASAEQGDIRARQLDVSAANASAVRSKVSRDNAKVQLDSTTVRAPRDGVVTLKYLEEGTIIPPGTSTFAQGTSLVQISDTTQMYVECQVDEADIATVKLKQPVRIVVDAYPGRALSGTVTKIFPAAISTSGVTTVKVRVAVGDEIKEPGGKGRGKRSGGGAPGGLNGSSGGGPGAAPGGSAPPVAAMVAPPRETAGPMLLRPGLNATVEFIQLQKKDVVMLPMPAIKRDGGKAYVQVKTSDPLKPERREVKLGEIGNTDVEVLEGLNEGDEVVVAEIDLRSMRERQAKMLQQEQGGGLGSQQKGGPSKSRGGM